MPYVSFPIESSPFVILQNSIDYIKSRTPLWQEHDDTLDTWILQVMATNASDLRELATTVPDTIFRYFGDTVLGLPPSPTTSAEVDSTWTSIDLTGHLIPGGTIVAIKDDMGVQRGFAVLNDVSIAPGLDTTPVGAVPLIATVPGSESSDIGDVGEQIDVITGLDWVETVTLVSKTSGGVDAETTEDYMARLVEYMRGLSTRPILEEDYARLARGVPGVHRAIGIDGYNPADDTYFNERMITVIGIDKDGNDLSNDVQDDLDSFLQAQREVNFIVNVIDSSKTQINVTFVVKTLPNFSTASVEGNTTAAVTDYLHPKNWAKDPTVIGAGSDRTWVEDTYLRYHKLVQVIENVAGVAYLQSLLFGRSTDVAGTADVLLDSPGALTVPHIIDGTAIV